MTKEFVSIQIGKIDRPQASDRHPRVHQSERIGVDVGVHLHRHHQKRPERFDLGQCLRQIHGHGLQGHQHRDLGRIVSFFFVSERTP